MLVQPGNHMIGYSRGLAAECHQAYRTGHPIQCTEADTRQIDVHEQVAGEIRLYLGGPWIDRLNPDRRVERLDVLILQVSLYLAFLARLTVECIPMYSGVCHDGSPIIPIVAVPEPDSRQVVRACASTGQVQPAPYCPIAEACQGLPEKPAHRNVR